MYSKIEKAIEEYKHRGMANSTIETYEIHLRHYYSYLKQNDLNYRTLKPKDIRQYTKASANRGDSNSTINVRLSAIKTFYDYAVEQEYTDHNPIIKTLYLQGKTTKTKPLNHEEKDIILGYMNEREEHIRLAFHVMFYAGLRVSEVANLKREDINIINGRVTVHIIHGKREGERTVPVFDIETAEQLIKYTREQIIDPLFKVKKRTFQYHAEQASLKTGISFSVHQARHTFATERLQEGIRLDILQKLMGHKDISTTMLYARTMDIDVINSAKPIGSGYNE